MSTDSHRIGRAFARHYKTYDQHAVVQHAVAERLGALIGQYAEERSIRRALEIGMGTGLLSRLLARRFPDAEWWFNDLVPEALHYIPADLANANVLPGDAEQISFPDKLDLIASASAVQWFDDLPSFFDKAFAAMSPGALLALSSFSDGHFRELSLLTGRALPYPTPSELVNMAELAGFSLLCCEHWQQVMSFPTLRDLMHHLRSTGVNGRSTALIRSPMRVRLWETQSRKLLNEGESPDLPLTYAPIILCVRRSKGG